MKPRPRKVSAETEANVLREYTEGKLSIRAIAAKYGVSNAYPTLAARRAGLPMKLSDEERNARAIRRG